MNPGSHTSRPETWASRPCSFASTSKLRSPSHSYESKTSSSMSASNKVEGVTSVTFFLVCGAAGHPLKDNMPCTSRPPPLMGCPEAVSSCRGFRARWKSSGGSNPLRTNETSEPVSTKTETGFSQSGPAFSVAGTRSLTWRTLQAAALGIFFSPFFSDETTATFFLWFDSDQRRQSHIGVSRRRLPQGVMSWGP